MPLKFTKHSPPELLEELRNLYRRVDRADQVTQTIINVIGDSQPSDPIPGDSIHAWEYRSIIGGNMPNDGTVVLTAPLVTLTGRAYKHLEVDVAIMEASGVSIDIDWIIRGDTSFFMWDPISRTWRLYGSAPVLYTADGLPFVAGRYRLEPQYAQPPEDGDLAYTPILPSDVKDFQHTFTLVGTANVGGDPSLTFCFKAWWVGRYVTWKPYATKPDVTDCPDFV